MIREGSFYEMRLKQRSYEAATAATCPSSPQPGGSMGPAIASQRRYYIYTPRCILFGMASCWGGGHAWYTDGLFLSCGFSKVTMPCACHFPGFGTDGMISREQRREGRWDFNEFAGGSYRDDTRYRGDDGTRLGEAVGTYL